MDLVLIDLLESSKAIGLCPMGSHMFRSKSKKVKNGLKLNVMFTLLVQFLVESVFFQITSFQLNNVWN